MTGLQPYHLYFYQKLDDYGIPYRAGSFSTLIRAEEAESKLLELAGGEDSGLRGLIAQVKLDTYDVESILEDLQTLLNQ